MLKFRKDGASSGIQTYGDPESATNRTQDTQNRASTLVLQMVAMSRDDIKKPQFWKAVLAEFVGTILLILFGCGAWIQADVDQHLLTVRIALTFGLSYAVLLYALRDISGGHVNPTVTVAMVVTRRISLARAVCYCLAQFIGASVGAALLYGFTPSVHRQNLGGNYTSSLISPEQGFGIEVFISFFYVFVVCSSYGKVDRTECVVHRLFTPFIIGFAAIVVHLYAVPHTGAGLNPARSFGPALVTGLWTNHWVFWFGPLIGGTIGGVLYQTAFSHKATIENLTSCMVTHDNDSDDFKESKKPYVRFTPPTGGENNPKSFGNHSSYQNDNMKSDKLEMNDGSVTDDENGDDDGDDDDDGDFYGNDGLPQQTDTSQYITSNHVGAVPMLHRQSATPMSETESEITPVSPINIAPKDDCVQAVVSIEDEFIDHCPDEDMPHSSMTPSFTNLNQDADIKVVYDHLHDEDGNGAEEDKDEFMTKAMELEMAGLAGFEHKSVKERSPPQQVDDFQEDPIVVAQQRMMESEITKEENCLPEANKIDNISDCSNGNDKAVQIPYDEKDPEGSNV